MSELIVNITAVLYGFSSVSMHVVGQEAGMAGTIYI
jgi:hypothetical protein